MPGGTPYDGLYGQAPLERSTFYRTQVYEMVGISRKSVCKRPKVARRIYGCVENISWFCDLFKF